jgi:hypothetical protein
VQQEILDLTVCATYQTINAFLISSVKKHWEMILDVDAILVLFLVMLQILRCVTPELSPRQDQHLLRDHLLRDHLPRHLLQDLNIIGTRESVHNQVIHVLVDNTGAQRE